MNCPSDKRVDIGDVVRDHDEPAGLRELFLMTPVALGQRTDDRVQQAHHAGNRLSAGLLIGLRERPEDRSGAPGGRLAIEPRLPLECCVAGGLVPLGVATPYGTVTAERENIAG